MILLGSPFFPEFILFYFAKWQFFLEKTSCTLKNTSFSISLKLFTKYQKSVVKKFMGIQAIGLQTFVDMLLQQNMGFPPAMCPTIL
jgi:hypothetical protein